MLNIVKFNLLKKNNTKNSISEVKTIKHFPSSIREWNNSIYVYNGDALNLISDLTISSVKIIKSYFSLYNKKLERKMRTKRLLLRLRRLSSNKIYVSNGEFKHTNNKVIINLYLFNRQKHNYMLALRKLYLKKIFGIKKRKKRSLKETNFRKLKNFFKKRAKFEKIGVKTKSSQRLKNLNFFKKAKLAINKPKIFLTKSNHKANWSWPGIKSHVCVKYKLFNIGSLIRNSLERASVSTVSKRLNFIIYKPTFKAFVIRNPLERASVSTVSKRLNFIIHKPNFITDKSKNFMSVNRKPKFNISKFNRISNFYSKISFSKYKLKYNIFLKFMDRKLSEIKTTFNLYKGKDIKPYIFTEINNITNISNYLINKDRSNVVNKYKKTNETTKKLSMKKRKKIKKCTKFNKFLVEKINAIKIKSLLLFKLIDREKYFIIKNLKFSKEKKVYSCISAYVTKFHKNFLKKSLRKIKLYFYYRQLIYVNNSKYNFNYLQYLTNSLYSLYNKNIEYNLINLKRFYLHSDILSESITLKINNNKRRMLRKLKSILKKIKIKNNETYLDKKPVKKKLDFKKDSTKNKSNLENKVVSNIKYKQISGFRLQAKGRLTRRYTASRSISKTTYAGNLLNMDSSYKRLSSVLLRNNLKSNLQYTKLKSKTRIGSFGIKGWVSGN